MQFNLITSSVVGRLQSLHNSVWKHLLAVDKLKVDIEKLVAREAVIQISHDFGKFIFTIESWIT